MRFSHTYSRALAFAALAASVLVPFAHARAADAEPADADAAAMKEEEAYIAALIEANMPDFAEIVIAAAKKKWPQLGPKLKVLEIQGDLRLGKFADVQKVIDGMQDKNGSEYWALKLSMADAYYARSMMAECRKIYQEFFAKVQKPGPELVDFYVQAGFTWAQICVAERNFDEAVKMYGGLLSKNLPEERWCAVAMEAAGLFINLAEDIKVEGGKDKALLEKRKSYLAQATALVDKLLWKNDLIIVFGKAIAMKAHIEMLTGNVEKAQSLVNGYMPQLAEIHNSLLEQDPDGKLGYVRMSPMPECRYLLAKMLWDVAKAEAKAAKPDDAKITAAILGAKVNGKRNGLGAFNHAVNVYVKYPESSVAADAGQIYEEIAAFVQERYKKDLKKAVNISPDQMAKVRQAQFNNAYSIFKGSDFAGALKAYTALLKQFPDAEEAPGAIAILADCNLALGQNERDAKKKQEFRAAATAAEEELVKQFAGKGDARERAAGDELLRLAIKERETGALARSQEVYDLYFKNFGSHYNASQTALSLAGQAMKAEDWEKAIHFYEMVATAYTNSPYYASSLQCLSTCHGKLGNSHEQESWLRKFANVAKKPSEKISSQLSLALMEQKRGFASFDAAAGTNDVAAAESLRKQGYGGVAGAIKDFRATTALIGKALEDKGLPAAERDTYVLQREQAQYLEGESWQRLQWPADKIPAFRGMAVKAYENYLATNPKGRYAPQILVKIGTIWTAEKNMEKSQEAFARLQKEFPDSDEAKNSVPRLAKTLIEMGLRAEGVAQYRQMLSTPDGKYTAGQFLMAGNALLDAKGWDVAQEAYAKAIDLSKGASNATAIVQMALVGQAKALKGAESWSEAHQKLDDFTEKYGKSRLVVDAYEMIVEIAAEEGRREKDDDMRRKYFNAAVGALKKVRAFKKTKADLDILELRSAEILVRKMEAEEAMGLAAKAEETARLAVSGFQAFLMSHEPTEAHPAKDMTPAELANLERCYAAALPLMAKILPKMADGSKEEKEAKAEQRETIVRYANTYLELFPDGKRKTDVQNALNSVKAD
ncbi:MAG: tol-pal system YbgF family protein [Kiritimatiellia bacterium]